MVLTDRHFIAEHFDILFAIFGQMVQKLCHFKVHINSCHLFEVPEDGPNSFRTVAGLARETDRWGSSHAGTPRRPAAHPQV